MTRPTPDRHVALEGTVNLRDLGGYETADGRRVRWRRLFRSDSLADVTDTDLEILDGLGLRTLCDLRDAPEREAKPNRVLRGNVRVHELRVFPPRAKEVFEGVGSMEVSEIEEWLCDVFRSFVLDHQAPYARVLDALLEPDALPALVHCTSGRDRTGFAAIVVLCAVGVPRETIVADYLLSDVAHRDIDFLIGAGVDPVKVTAMTRPRAEYVDVGFATMEEVFGSVDAYLREGLGLDADRRALMQELLLEA